MVTELDPSDVLQRLRREAATDPKLARSSFQVILRGPPDVLTKVLVEASGPGDGRLRQVIAMVHKADRAATALTPWLTKWLESEPDEFTKNAIEAALAAHDPAPANRPTSRIPPALVVGAYRYVANRLCHRVRGSLLLTTSQLVRLNGVVGGVRDPQLKQDLAEILAGFQTGVQQISRTVEFDTGDDYLTWQSIPLVAWLETAFRQFEARSGSAQLAIGCHPSTRQLRIRATRFLLDTIFGNLWLNSIQNSDSPHLLQVQCGLDSTRSWLDLTIVDNGAGFAEDHFETAFQQVFSTSPGNRGHGLMEVADAVATLQGTVRLARMPTSDIRIVVGLPVEAA